MRWIGDELDVQLPSFPKELEGEVRGVSVKKNDSRLTTCFLSSGWIEIFDEPVQCNLAVRPAVLRTGKSSECQIEFRLIEQDSRCFSNIIMIYIL